MNVLLGVAIGMAMFGIPGLVLEFRARRRSRLRVDPKNLRVICVCQS